MICFSEASRFRFTLRIDALVIIRNDQKMVFPLRFKNLDFTGETGLFVDVFTDEFSRFTRLHHILRGASRFDLVAALAPLRVRPQQANSRCPADPESRAQLPVEVRRAVHGPDAHVIAPVLSPSGELFVHGRKLYTMSTPRVVKLDQPQLVVRGTVGRSGAVHRGVEVLPREHPHARVRVGIIQRRNENISTQHSDAEKNDKVIRPLSTTKLWNVHFLFFFIWKRNTFFVRKTQQDKNVQKRAKTCKNVKKCAKKMCKKKCAKKNVRKMWKNVFEKCVWKKWWRYECFPRGRVWTVFRLQ